MLSRPKDWRSAHARKEVVLWMGGKLNTRQQGVDEMAQKRLPPDQSPKWWPVLVYPLACLIFFALSSDALAGTSTQATQTFGERIEPYGQFKLLRGKKWGICRKLDAGFSAHPALPQWDYCALPLGADREFRRPKWSALNPEAQMDLVKEIYYWSSRPAGFAARQELNEEAPPSKVEIEKVWEAATQSWRKKGIIEKPLLERARIDLNNDGHVDSVYRLSVWDEQLVPPVLRNETGRILRDKLRIALRDTAHPVISKICARPFIDGVSRSFNIFVRSEDDPLLHRDVLRRLTPYPMDVFYYRGRTYLGGIGRAPPYVLEPIPRIPFGTTGLPLLNVRGLTAPEELCQFTFESGE